MPATLDDIQRKYGESVYPLYKDQMHEPYMESESGKGYAGVVLYDELEDKVQCAECGKWFKDLGAHLYRNQYKMTIKAYKRKHGIYGHVALCSKAKSKKLSKGQRVAWSNKSDEEKKKQLSYLAKGRIGHKREQRIAFGSNMQKNKYGFCDAQIASRLIIVREMTNKGSLGEVTMRDIETHDLPLYKRLKRKYGGMKSAVKDLGLNNKIRRKRYEDAEVIAYLRKWVVKHKRMPSSNDVSRKHPIDVGNGYNLGMGTIYARFGSWRRAKMMAGLDQLLAEVK